MKTLGNTGAELIKSVAYIKKRVLRKKGNFPGIQKYADIRPAFKIVDKTDKSNYRPILKNIWKTDLYSDKFIYGAEPVKIFSSRSSCWQEFFKISALKNFAIFTEKHLCWSLFLIKLQLC